MMEGKQKVYCAADIWMGEECASLEGCLNCREDCAIEDLRSFFAWIKCHGWGKSKLSYLWGP